MELSNGLASKKERQKFDHMVCLESVRVVQPPNSGSLILQSKNSKINTHIKINIKINTDKHEKDPDQGRDYGFMENSSSSILALLAPSSALLAASSMMFL